MLFCAMLYGAVVCCGMTGFNKVLEMFPQDASYAVNLARRACMKFCKLNDHAGGLADVKAADQISPILHFHQLKILQAVMC